MSKYLFSLLLFFSFFGDSYAYSRLEVYTICVNYIHNNTSYYCEDEPNADGQHGTFFLTLYDTNYRLRTFLSYSSQCDDPTHIYSSSTHTCSPSSSVTCPDGSTAATLAACPSPCPSGFYRLNGSCTPIPDCNANYQNATPTTVGGGHFFNTTTNQCEDSGMVMQCFNSPSPTGVFCPTIVDCIPSGVACTDAPQLVQSGIEIKGPAVAAATTNAIASQAAASTSASQAVTASSAAALAKDQAQVNSNAAQAALSAAQSNPASTSAQLSAAAQAYGEALNALTKASSNLSNATASAGSAQQAADAAAQAAGGISMDGTTGMAQNGVSVAAQAAAAAAQAAADALAGGGSGSGSTLGQGIGAATEGTLNGIKDALTNHGAGLGQLSPGAGSGRGNGTPTDTDGDGECDVDCGSDTDGDGQCDVDCGNEKGNFNQSIADAEDALVSARDQLDTKMTEIRSSVSSIFGSSITNGSGSLPIVDFGTLKGVHVMLDMNAHADQLSIISTIIMALAWLSALSIILSR